ncbi:MAG: hypothetical protein II077_03525, partial [Treponema sp.]|nr:hypothetical protein [Treponema sp.]
GLLGRIFGSCFFCHLKLSFIFALSITSTIVSHNKIFVFAFFSTRKPIPDWKGGAAGHRNEVRRLERKRNPGKRVKNALPGIFNRQVFWRKLAVLLPQKK